MTQTEQAQTAYKQVRPGIHQLKVPIPNNPLGYVLPYLVEDEKGYVMFDSGWNAPEAYGALMSQLMAIGPCVIAFARQVIAGGERSAGSGQDDCPDLRVVAGLQKRRVVTEKEKRILAYHEAGHALMSYLMGDALPVQKVTIVSRGQALGYTLNMPMEERYLHTKEELVDVMRIYLAGRAAENVVFGRVTNGAASFAGTTAGLGPEGLLLVRRDDGQVVTVISGDVAEAR